MASTSRTASVSRKTSETSVEVFLDLDCAPGSNVKQTIDVSTGIGFLDHVRLPPAYTPNYFLIVFADVYCIGQAWWNVVDYEMQRRSVDR